MTGWLDTLFGNLPPQPKRPASRGAMPGLQPYQQMPDPKATVTDERGQTDQAFWMKNYYDQSNEGKYQPSMRGVDAGAPQTATWDPTQSVAPLVVGLDNDWAGQGYKPSFQPNWRPPYSRQAPYRPSPVLHNSYGDNIGPMGPNLPRGPVGTSQDPEMPYLGPQYPPISPGPGWQVPPSVSGPHNPGGDPPRPGYDRPPEPMTAASQPSFQQLINFLQSRGGTS